MPKLPARTARTGLAALCLLLAGLALALHAPGHLTTDSSIQLHEAASGRIESWAPPFMSALLYWLGMGTMATSLFVLINVAATYGGLFLAARPRDTDPAWPWWRIAATLALVANPVIFAYVGIVWKDVLLASLCTLALGLSVAAWRSATRRGRVTCAALALLVLLPIPMVRQQGLLLLPVFAISPAWLIASTARPGRRKTILAATAVAVLGGYLLLKLLVAASFASGPDGRDLSVGTRIIKTYDLVGIQVRTGAAGPLARAGASPAALAAMHREYGGDRVDRLGADPELRAFLDTVAPRTDALWLTAIREHPLAYGRHRLSAFSWLAGLHAERTCLPFQVGVEGIDAFLAESGMRQERELRDLRLYDFYLHFVHTPLWKHWLYIIAVCVALLLAARRGGMARTTLLPWGIGLGLFAGSFLPTSIACDFRYLYLLVPGIAGVLLALLTPRADDYSA